MKTRHGRGAVLWTRRVIGLFVFVVLPIGLTGAGCAENAAATSKCKSSPSSDKCNECCTKEGASGHTYVSNSGCTCRGG